MSLYRHILMRHHIPFNANRPGIAHIYNLHRIGKREVVGYGMCGSTKYVDSIICPMPAIRFQEFQPHHEVKSNCYIQECITNGHLIYVRSHYARENAVTGRR